MTKIIRKYKLTHKTNKKFRQKTKVKFNRKTNKKRSKRKTNKKRSKRKTNKRRRYKKLLGGNDPKDEGWMLSPDRNIDSEEKCNLCVSGPQGNKDLSKVKHLLRNSGFTEIGQGGFGIVMVNRKDPMCAIKFLIDPTRCKELETEYNISNTLWKDNTLGFGLTYPILFKNSNDYCQFNQRLVLGSTTLIGDIIDVTNHSSNPDQQYYRLKTVYGNEDITEIMETKEINIPNMIIEDEFIYIPKNDANWGSINKLQLDKQKELTHLYLNKEGMNDRMPGRGFIRGVKVLKQLYDDVLNTLVLRFGIIMRYIVVDKGLSPNDVEVVLQRNKEYGLSPTVIDFNEAKFIPLDEGNDIWVRDDISAPNDDPEIKEERIRKGNLRPVKEREHYLARGMYQRNGRDIFPTRNFIDKKDTPNPLYSFFEKGFTNGSNDSVAINILQEYNELLTDFGKVSKKKKK